jgi:uncharacterized protein (TIGR02246 family)
MKLGMLAFAGSAALFVAGLQPAAAQAKDPALDKLAADWTAAFAKGDAKALAGLYTENAVRVTPEGGRVVGRNAIEQEFVSNFAGPWKGARITISVGAIQAVSAEVAVNEGSFEVSGLHTPDGKPAPPVKGHYLNTIVKKGGAWMLASNAAVAPAAAPAR